VIEIDHLVSGPFQNTLDPDEIVVEAVIPAPQGTVAGGYLKLERRVGDFATVATAVAIETSEDVVIRAGIALAGVGGSTINAAKAAEALVGKPLTADTIGEAAARAAEAARPGSDHRGSAAYKKHIVATFVTRILSQIGASEEAA
jgi:carbon-monoxide dehydrogenase medium subunit